jgi:formylglycine-generating enzyme required for sulfatase activity
MRDWLTRKQKETRRGRAELRLAERAALWQAKPENRHLPSSWEYLTSVWLVPAKNRTAVQRTMLRTAGRVHAVRWGSALAILLLTGLVIGNVLGTERKSSLRRQVTSAFDRLQNDRGPAVRYTLRDLERLPREMVVAEIGARYAEPEPRRKLGLAYAKAQYGDVDVAFLVSRIEPSAAEEVDNFAGTFARARPASLEAIHDLAKRATAEKNWRLKARLGVMSLHLEDDQIAADMARINDRPDPVERTIFIDELRAWHGDVARLVTFCQSRSDAALRSGLCLAIGGIPSGQLTEAECNAWKPALTHWYETASDGGTHSAASWALRKWRIDAPALPTTSQPSEGRQWLVNSVGMTLLKINPGVFVRKEDTAAAKDQTEVLLTRAFFMSDREISVGQFQQFISDTSYATEEKPERWEVADKQISPTSDHPVQQVDWYDAVLFCNWLSRKEGRTTCYERTLKKEKGQQSVERDAWRLVAAATGYRLPTEAEWEYACRAGTTTNYASGDDEEMLRKYAVFQASLTDTCGSRLPNGWGLFDMHGNVWEWCWDGYAIYNMKSPTIDPAGEPGAFDRVIRGGAWGSPAVITRASSRRRTTPGDQGNYMGFRVARGENGR